MTSVNESWQGFFIVKIQPDLPPYTPKLWGGGCCDIPAYIIPIFLKGNYESK
ncbi:MAG: hypothetical protein IPH11_04880 [Ignavibacteriales bacterium]|nr:hypothetical protein [Ignavibacteriales bacterium]